MTIPIVINHSIPHFNKSASDIADGLRAEGAVPIILDNLSIREKLNFCRFEKCVFLDKDIPLGLQMEISGTRLFNNIGSIELCSDKRRTNSVIGKDFRTPETVCYPLTYFPNEDFFLSFAKDLAEKLGLPLIAKLANGSQGREVYLLDSIAQIIDFQRKYYQTPHLYQQYISQSKGRDMRVYVIGGEAVAAMIRKNDSDFRSNIALGGSAEKVEISDEVASIATDISLLLGLDFCGIDLLFGEDGFLVCEVNSNALFNTINEVCDINIGHLIAHRVVSFKNA